MSSLQGGGDELECPLDVVVVEIEVRDGPDVRRPVGRRQSHARLAEHGQHLGPRQVDPRGVYLDEVRLQPVELDRHAGGMPALTEPTGALVVDGLTQKEIGARLYISPKTVEQHVARMRQKLAASNRAALVAALRTQLGP